MRDITKLDKTPFDRLIEFFQSMCIISDCFDLISQGKLHQLIPLYGQLRALLTDDAKKNIPLMKDIASILDVKLLLYYSEAQSQGIGMPEPVFQMDTLFVSLEKEFSHQVQIDLFDFIDKPTIKVNENFYKLNEIIDFLANKSGGAHYANKIETYVNELFSYNQFRFNGISPTEQLLIQFGKIIYELGNKILDRLTSLHIIFSCYIDKQELEGDSIILDFASSKTSLRFLLFLNKDKFIGIHIVDATGNPFTFVSDKPIDLNDICKTIEVELNINSDFKNEIKLIINDVVFINTKSNVPFFFINELGSFDFFINRSREIDNNGLFISHGTMSAFNTVLDNDKIEHKNKFKKDLEESDIFRTFHKGSYGVKDSEKGIMNYSGKFDEKLIKK